MHNASGLRQSILLAVCLGALSTVTWGGDMPSAASDTQKNIQVAITGTAETRYAATWTVTDSNGNKQQFEESGQVPASSAYSGEAIAGTVTVLSDLGRLEVEIRKSGNRSRSSTQGKGSVIKIQVQ